MIIELLGKLEAIGYQVSLNGDKISLDFIGASIPPDEAIVPLVESLRQRKAEVVQFLRQGDYEAAFNKAVGEVSSKYDVGMIEFVRKSQPEVFRKVEVSEARINEHWDSNFLAFCEAVEDWKSVCLSMIDLHRNAQKYLCECGRPGERLMLCTQPQYKARWYCLKCKPYRNI